MGPMKIKVLPSEVVDQIAAGEVVERPAHLIKELVENSLDAGSTEIEIFYDQGGRYVRVTDNGKGISLEDLSRALDRFATSKIELSTDLWRLKTFGFRGEALASISSVSRLTLKSRTAQAEMASQIVSEFGRRSEVNPVGASFGTTVQIEDLFANTPVRLKFLKSDSAESVQIKQMLKGLALANPQVQFKIFQGKDLLFLWPAVGSRKERAEQVLEMKALYEGQAERGAVKAFSVFADPNTTSKTARQIWLFAQNRWIQDRGMQAAVMEAYRSLLMHGEYPIAAVWVECDPEFVDVNVHPTKSQVKFQDASFAFRAVQASLRDYLEKAPWVEEIMKRNSVATDPQNSASPHEMEIELLKAMETSALRDNLAFQDHAFETTQFSKKSFPLADQKKDFLPESFSQEINKDKNPLDLKNHDLNSNNGSRIKLETWSRMAPTQKTSLTQEVANLDFEVAPSLQKRWSLLQILGQANLTYIVCQSREGLIFIDQHAAHERVAYEKLMSAWKGGKIEIQDFLFPLSLDLSPDKVEALKRVFEDFEKLGLHLEVLGPSTVGVNAAPLFLKDHALLETLEKTSQDLIDFGGSFRFEKTVGDCCATMACHSVVRAGQALSLEQMRSLLEEMDEFPMSTFCPHGRPVYVEYPFMKLEKDFGRLV
jgi:DNA mismatch repair protein MutL